MGHGKMLLISGATAAAALLAGCSGGSDQKAKQDSAAANQSGAAAPAAGSGATAPAVTTTAAPKLSPESTDTISGATLAQFTGDPASGEKVFIQCKTCHVTDPGVNRVGPSLHGIVGRTAGQVAGFNYSAANKNSGITWTDAKLFQYLENPQRVVPGTKMAFGGISDNQKRADLIAWLKTQGS
ncbi:MAG TPA: cytochrome c family protein [Allosphingosinicella sp.]|jgi:cytochrome c